MNELICENPPIERNRENTRILLALCRAKLANWDGPLVTVNWQKIIATEGRLYLENGIGSKSVLLIKQWAKSAQHSVQRMGVRAVRKNRYSSSHVGGKHTHR